MAEPLRWLKGTLTGNCVGKPHRKVGGSGLARWYKLELVDAVISDWTPVPGPPSTAPEGPAPFCQAKLKDARLRSRTPGGEDEELSLRELSVWNWTMRDQREAGGESRCTLVGTVYAREVDGTRRPALPDGADRLDRWGCLALLVGLLVAFWLWWTCGPFTCALWSTVVLTSWWTHRTRTRRRTPPSTLSKVLQSVLALLLIVGGVGLVMGLADPSQANSCSGLASLAVLLAVGSVVGASLLTVSWHLPWTWALWTAVVVLWCGRTGTDCAGLWLTQGKDLVVGRTPANGDSLLDELRRRATGEPEGAAAPLGAPGSGPRSPAGDGGAERQSGDAGFGTPTEHGAGTGTGDGTSNGPGAGLADGPGPGGDSETGPGATDGGAPGTGTPPEGRPGSGTGDGTGSGTGDGTGSGTGDGTGSGAGTGLARGFVPGPGGRAVPSRRWTPRRSRA